MKRIVFSLLLCFQSLFASIQEYKSENMRIIICNDFFLPIAKIGVFYSVGLNQLKNICEAKVIQEKFLSKNTKISAKNLGISLNVDILDTFSEVSAIVSNDKIAEIIKIILNNDFDVENLELTKDTLRISQKISEYFETNAKSDEIYATINSKRIFNRSILDKFTEIDLQNCMDIFQKSSKTIIICGNFDTEQLVKTFHLKKSTFPEKNELSVPGFTPKTIELRSKFLGRSLYYICKINHSSDTQNQRAILSVLNHEMFDYFKKHSQLIDNFFFTSSSQLNFLMLGVKIRKDVSKKSFETNLLNFFKYIKKSKLSPEKLKSISQIEKFSEIDDNENIHAKYQEIVNQYILCEQLQTSVSEEILKISSEDIADFIEKVFESNSVIKISTQYKAEN